MKNARTSIQPMRQLLWRSLSAIAVLVVALFPLAASAATLPSGFSETLVASGITNPTAMAFAPDGRLFVCQQNGQLRVIKNGVLLPTPFVSLSVDPAGERGLLGVAFDPEFGTNGFVYVYFTVSSTPRHNRVTRFTAKGDLAVAGSETLILRLNDLSSATNHNGGALHFGPDAKLYVAVGENANGAHAQTLSNLLGKMLRINSDGSIPADNPFVATATGDNRAVWALGLRNPYTFAFQPGSGRMFINDVGQSTWEEINDGVAGSNYGWPITEGPTNDPRFRGPIFAYGRSPSTTGGCAITGGAFYNPAVAQFPGSFVGKYLFADFCSGWIRILDPETNTASAFASGVANPVDLHVARDGTLHYLARGSGSVFRIRSDAAPIPTPAPATNDQFANRRTLAGPSGTISASNHAATKEGDEPNHGGDNGGASVWFSWTALVSGPVTVETRGSEFDTLLGVYTGTNVAGLTTLASNDDATANVRYSSVQFAAVAGQVYHVAVDGFGAVTGDLQLQWRGGGGKADFDGDGDGDLVWQNTQTGERVIWFLRDGAFASGAFLAAIAPEWQIAGAADFNADGHADLGWQNVANGQRAIWFLRDGQFQSSIFLPTIERNWEIASAADVDSDGHADLVWQNTVTGQRAIWLMRNGQFQSGTFLPTIAREWRIAGGADFNQDGHADLAWQNLNTGERVIWFLQNGQYQSGFSFATIAPEWQIAAAADFNADGHADLGWQNINTGERVIWFLRNGVFQSSSFLGTVDPVWQITGH